MLQGFSSDEFEFDNSRVRYPEEIKARSPRGLRARVRQAAEAEGLSMGEFIRRTLSERADAALSRVPREG